VLVLSRLFRRLMLEKLAATHKAGKLTFFGEHASLADPKAFAALLAPLKRTRWFVYSKRPFAGPKAVLAYLARYTHRVAISNNRLIAADGDSAGTATDPEAEAAADDGPQAVLATPCLCCGGRMIVVETFDAGCQPKHALAIRIDTS
jgi:Putative transposase